MLYYNQTNTQAHPAPCGLSRQGGSTMKFLKVMLAVLTCLAVTLTGVLLFVDKQIDNSED